MIKSHAKVIKEFVDLRNQQYAHFDFHTTPAISFNFELLPEINSLFNTAMEILNLCGREKLDESKATEFDLSDREYLDSLRSLLKKITT